MQKIKGSSSLLFFCKILLEFGDKKNINFVGILYKKQYLNKQKTLKEGCTWDEKREEE